MNRPDLKHLYKYRAFNERSLSILINKEIWVASPESFNDPFDCTIDIDKQISKEDYSEFMLEMGILKNTHIDEVINHICLQVENDNVRSQEINRIEKLFRKIAERTNQYGVFTLSELSSNILLWSHYADNHKGFCIEFLRSPNNNLGNNEITLPVEYCIKFPFIKLGEVKRNNEKWIMKALTTKAKDWEYEKEWRLFYKKCNVLERLPAPISGIIFGSRMKVQHKKTIKNVLKNEPNIKFMQAKKSKGKYSLDIVNI